MKALTPVLPVTLVGTDDRTHTWSVQLSGSMSGPQAPGTSDYVAVELPQAMVLHRHVVMPSLDEEELARAVTLDARASSPFPEDDLCWGHHVIAPASAERTEVGIVLASRSQIAAFLASRQPLLQGYRHEAEVWAPAVQAAPAYVILQGFGEGVRLAHHRRGRKANLVALALAAGLLLGMAITPTLQLRARAIEAVRAYDELNARAGQALASREALVRTAERQQQVHKLLGETLDPAQSIYLLTKALPDDSSLTALRIRGRKVTLEGQTTNAAELMQLLGRQPGFEEVVAPVPATRPFGSSKDIFKIELMLDPGKQAVPVTGGRGSASAAEAVPPEPRK
ncbi:PilN domain-containing protein [Pulveribacter sp.]|uniref:PilN domain-containing protein n=1 Tax=Pulveribacter sp. TaxID=2678893 RepID=UPI00289F1D32|nr:PilN domain-containing protein [Pulveribacter sp.]